MVINIQLLPSLYAETQAARSGGNRRWGTVFGMSEIHLTVSIANRSHLTTPRQLSYIPSRRRGEQDESIPRIQCTFHGRIK